MSPGLPPVLNTRLCLWEVGFPRQGGLCQISEVGPQASEKKLVFTSESGRQVSFRWVLDVWLPPWGLPGGGRH